MRAREIVTFWSPGYLLLGRRDAPLDAVTVAPGSVSARVDGRPNRCYEFLIVIFILFPVVSIYTRAPPGPAPSQPITGLIPIMDERRSDNGNGVCFLADESEIWNSACPGISHPGCLTAPRSCSQKNSSSIATQNRLLCRTSAWYKDRHRKVGSSQNHLALSGSNRKFFAPTTRTNSAN